MTATNNRWHATTSPSASGKKPPGSTSSGSDITSYTKLGHVPHPRAAAPLPPLPAPNNVAPIGAMAQQDRGGDSNPAPPSPQKSSSSPPISGYTPPPELPEHLLQNNPPLSPTVSVQAPPKAQPNFAVMKTNGYVELPVAKAPPLNNILQPPPDSSQPDSSGGFGGGGGWSGGQCRPACH